jgi:hypothetical protein
VSCIVEKFPRIFNWLMLCEIVRVFFYSRKNMLKNEGCIWQWNANIFFLTTHLLHTITQHQIFNKRATKCSFPKLCELFLPKKICGTHITLLEVKKKRTNGRSIKKIFIIFMYMYMCCCYMLELHVEWTFSHSLVPFSI